jgi:hypothetical protein
MKLWVVYLTTPHGKATEIFGVFDSPWIQRPWMNIDDLIS